MTVRKSERRDIFGMMGVWADRVPLGLSTRRAAQWLRESADAIDAYQDRINAGTNLIDADEESLCGHALQAGGVCASLVDEIRRGHIGKERES